MTTLTIKIPEAAQAKLSTVLKELGGEIVTIKKKTLKSQSEKEVILLKQIEDGLKDVSDIRSGKIKRISLSEGLRG